jgi:predicted dehydrogenase
MKFALLGADANTLALARTIVASAEHQLVWLYGLGEFEAQVRSLAPEAKFARHWEGVLDASLADAILVARAEDDDRTEALKKVFQAGIPLLLSHPVHDSLLVYYELDMIRRDSRAQVLPFLSARWHPATQRLRELYDSAFADRGQSPLGKLEQVVCERALAIRTQSNVLSLFVHDADLLRALAGELSKVGAMTPTGKDNPDQYANLGIQMSGPSNVLVRWSVGPVEDQAGARLMLLGSEGKATLWMPDAEQPWVLETRLGEQPGRETFDSWHPTSVVLARLAALLAGETVHPDWHDALRTMELADAIDHSLHRGRTIELQFGKPSEQATFKGMMSGVGCALLMVALLGTILATAVAGLKFQLAKIWPVFLLGVLVLFLLLQLLRLAFPADAAKKE